MRFTLMLLAVVALNGCKLDDAENKIAFGQGPGARMAVEAFGFKNVEIVGPVLFGCGRDDSHRIEFKAVGPAGHHVTGLVCGGLLFKGWTVRIDTVTPPASA